LRVFNLDCRTSLGINELIILGLDFAIYVFELLFSSVHFNQTLNTYLSVSFFWMRILLLVFEDRSCFRMDIALSEKLRFGMLLQNLVIKDLVFQFFIILFDHAKSCWCVWDWARTFVLPVLLKYRINSVFEDNWPDIFHRLFHPIGSTNLWLNYWQLLTLSVDKLLLNLASLITLQPITCLCIPDLCQTFYSLLVSFCYFLHLIITEYQRCQPVHRLQIRFSLFLTAQEFHHWLIILCCLSFAIACRVWFLGLTHRGVWLMCYDAWRFNWRLHLRYV